MLNTEIAPDAAPLPAEQAQVLARGIVETVREALVVLDGELRVKTVNPAFCQTFQVTPAETEGRLFFMLNDGQWDIPQLRTVLDELLHADVPIVDFEVQHSFQRTGGRRMLLNASRIHLPTGDSRLVLLAIEDVTEKRRTQEENERLRDELEERVRQRTAELEAANRELEAFAYSVSHDLRSPLRALDGYTRILQEEHAAGLPADVQEYVGDIRKNAKKMGQLIDDLLTFSRLSRQGLQKRTVAPAELVPEVLADLRAEQDGRHVDVDVQPLPPCQADPALLKQVWVNLVGNALKYTRKCPAPRIEIGSLERDGERVYYVRDNGVGFDMRYAGKLFGVFQRLHKAGEYEGTGVGLAIVQRIVHRHGGKVWAEAAVNQGATFYFTLPDCEKQA